MLENILKALDEIIEKKNEDILFKDMVIEGLRKENKELLERIEILEVKANECCCDCRKTD